MKLFFQTSFRWLQKQEMQTNYSDNALCMFSFAFFGEEKIIRTGSNDFVQ